MGKNVTGFAEGDRVVADVGITVRISASSTIQIFNHDDFSAGTVSTAVGVKRCSARILMLAVLPWMAALRNTLLST
jgi:hypothetical protein